MANNQNNNDKKNEKRFKATTPGKRFFKLAGMSASIAKNYAGHKVKGMFSDEEAKKQSQDAMYADIGIRIAETLGEMKGAVMKVGQIVSQVKDLLPPEVAKALETLQKESPPMPYSMIRRQLIRALGDEPESLFATFEHEPFAAASIGQVHRATTKDGVECIVKIQYPGVKESCDSDLKQIKRLFKMAGLVKVSKEVVDKTFDEIRDMLYEELDYNHEAENLRFFNEHYKDHPYVIVPELLEDFSSETVLTLTYIEGDSLTEVKAPSYSQEIKNTLALRLFDTMGRQIYELQRVHCDPHPGNFAFRPDGSLIIYDFGAVKKVTDDTVRIHKNFIKDMFNGKVDSVEQHLKEMGVRQDDGPDVPLSYYQEWFDIIMEPFSDNTNFDFSQSRLHLRAAKKIRKDAFKYLGAFQPSPETMHVDRVLSGHYWTLIDLDANISLRGLIEEILLKEAA
ncbi:MAG: AarF/ABC1/UbiB kinase family protein [Pseudomonadales bacterium]|nr:AarF/ABC1/UbiB kinase family protein [Pseudomonadales bacterium]